MVRGLRVFLPFALMCTSEPSMMRVHGIEDALPAVLLLPTVPPCAEPLEAGLSLGKPEKSWI